MSRSFFRLASGLLSGAVLSIALVAQADDHLALDNEGSRVSMLSTKVMGDGTSSAIEQFWFDTLEGTVDKAGNAEVQIDLASIQTGVDIRNERMVQYLFETAQFPAATITAQVPSEVLENGLHSIDLPFTLDLHGATKELSVPVQVSASDAALVVTAREPVLLDAASFGLEGGLAQLAELAKLLHIPTAVPVSFNLTFQR